MVAVGRGAVCRPRRAAGMGDTRIVSRPTVDNDVEQPIVDRQGRRFCRNEGGGTVHLDRASLVNPRCDKGNVAAVEQRRIDLRARLDRDRRFWIEGGTEAYLVLVSVKTGATRCRRVDGDRQRREDQAADIEDTLRPDHPTAGIVEPDPAKRI